MREGLGILAFFAGFGAVLVALVWLARRVRRRGIGGGLMGPVDEIWRPDTHRLRHEIEMHEQRVMPIPAPEDHDGRRCFRGYERRAVTRSSPSGWPIGSRFQPP